MGFLPSNVMRGVHSERPLQHSAHAAYSLSVCQGSLSSLTDDPAWVILVPAVTYSFEVTTP